MGMPHKIVFQPEEWRKSLALPAQQKRLWAAFCQRGHAYFNNLLLFKKKAPHSDLKGYFLKNLPLKRSNTELNRFLIL